MKELIAKLHTGHYSCVISKDGNMQGFTQRGIADLYDLLTKRPDCLQGACIADKVVGKGAAALMILGGIQRVYADVISQSAYTLLCQWKVDVEYQQIVPYIINRTHTDWCPVEKATYHADTPQAILPIIHKFIEQQRNHKIS